MWVAQHMGMAPFFVFCASRSARSMMGRDQTRLVRGSDSAQRPGRNEKPRK